MAEDGHGPDSSTAPRRTIAVLHPYPSIGGHKREGRHQTNGAAPSSPGLCAYSDAPVQPQELEELHSRQVSQAPARIMRVELQALSGHTLPVKPCFLAISSF